MAHLASVAISDKDGRQVLHEIVRKPEESKVLKSSRKWCPITEDQFVYTRMSEEVFGVEAGIKAVRQRVLNIMKKAAVVVMHNAKDLEVLRISED